MIAHEDEIYSRPKRTWFAIEKEKKIVAKAAKVSFNSDGNIMEVLTFDFNFANNIFNALIIIASNLVMC